MREKHRLSMLKVRHAGKHRRARLIGGVKKRRAQVKVRLHKALGERLRRKARIGRDLVVPRAPGVQATAGLADTPRKLGLDRHVDVLIRDIEREVAGIDVVLDILEPVADGFGVFLGDDPLRGEHPRMRARPRDILLIQRLIDRQRRAKRLRRERCTLFEPTVPQCHGCCIPSFSRIS